MLVCATQVASAPDNPLGYVNSAWVHMERHEDHKATARNLRMAIAAADSDDWPDDIIGGAARLELAGAIMLGGEAVPLPSAPRVFNVGEVRTLYREAKERQAAADVCGLKWHVADETSCYRLIRDFLRSVEAQGLPDSAMMSCTSMKRKSDWNGCTSCGLDPIREGGDNGLKVCSGCKMVRYCSRECQKEHWRAGHKRECAALRESRKQMLKGEEW